MLQERRRQISTKVLFFYSSLFFLSLQWEIVEIYYSFFVVLKLKESNFSLDKHPDPGNGGHLDPASPRN